MALKKPSVSLGARERAPLAFAGDGGRRVRQVGSGTTD